MTREEQIKDAAINFASIPKGEGEYLSIYRRGKEMGFKAGAEWAFRQSPWISVDEELPPYGEEVYVYSTVYSRYGEWKTKRYENHIDEYGYKTQDDKQGFDTRKAPYYSPYMQITHWRHKPPFPKKN